MLVDMSPGKKHFHRQFSGMQYLLAQQIENLEPCRRFTRMVRSFAAACLVLCILPAASAQEWIRQFGGDLGDGSSGLAGDGFGNVYSGGWTWNPRGPNPRDQDALLSKYDEAGTLLWSRVFGTSDDEANSGVSTDGLGNVYIAGRTAPELGTSALWDAFVSKYDDAGNLLWTRQFGTSEQESVSDVSADGLGNVYISGSTHGSLGAPHAGVSDVFVSKYDNAGNLQWNRQLGTSLNDFGAGVSADNLGNVYITGGTYGSLGGPNAGDRDAFLSKYDEAGNRLWIRQIGTSNFEYGSAVWADGLGNVYIAGRTTPEPINPSFMDAFVSKYDDAGNLLWTRRFGSSEYDASKAVFTDGLGNVYVSGDTTGSLGGPHAGSSDAFVVKYDAAGNLLWSQQIGTSDIDESNGVWADGLGTVYISGVTYGSLGARYVGLFGDGFVAKFVEPTAFPEPATATPLTILAAIFILTSPRRAVSVEGQFSRGIFQRHCAVHASEEKLRIQQKRGR